MSHQYHLELNKKISSCDSAEQLVEITSSNKADLNLVNCVTALQRLAKLEVPDSISTKDLHHLTTQTTNWMQSRDGGCQTRHISGVLWALAKLQCIPTDTVRATMERGSTMQPGWYKPQEVSMAVWGLGKLVLAGLSEEVADAAKKFILRLLPSALSRASSFDSQGLANICVGLAAVAPALSTAEHARVESALLRALRTRLAHFSAQEVANTLSALGKLGVRLDTCDGLAEEVRAACRGQLGAFSPQQLANAAHATARLQEASRGEGARRALDFWEVLGESVAGRSEELNGQELSMSAWAAAQALSSSTVAGEAVEEVAAALARATRHLGREQLAPQQVATLALALVKLNCRHRRTLRALAGAAREQIGGFNAQDLDNLASAFARVGRWRGPRLIRAIAQAGAAALGRGRAGFPSRNVSNLLCGVARMVQSCPGAEQEEEESVAALVEAAGREVEARIGEMTVKDLSNAAWGLAGLAGSSRLSKEGRRRMEAIGAAAAGKMGTFDAQECSRLLYALGRAGVRCAALEAAAGEARELAFGFEGVGRVRLKCVLGGASGKFWEREASGAIKGNGGALFEDAHVLATWLAQHPTPQAAAAHAAVPARLLERAARRGGGWRGLEAVELGAGLGLCSVVASRLGMRVKATDGDEGVLELLRENVRRNEDAAGEEGGGARGGEGHVEVQELTWGSGGARERLGLKRGADVVMATGCVYASAEEVWAALADTIAELAGPGTLVLLAHGNGAAPGVHQLHGSFYSAARERGFEVSRVEQSSVPAESSDQQLHCLVRAGGHGEGGAKRGRASESDGDEAERGAGRTRGGKGLGGARSPESAGRRRKRASDGGEGEGDDSGETAKPRLGKRPVR